MKNLKPTNQEILSIFVENKKIKFENDEFPLNVICSNYELPENINIDDGTDINILSILKKEKFKIVKWEPNKVGYPMYMLLSGDKGILAYIDFFHHKFDGTANRNLIARFGICYSLSELINSISLAYSDLDRPVFYVHMVHIGSDIKIYFETDEMIKNNILTRKNFIFDIGYNNLYFSNLNEMGDLDNLINIFNDLKTNNVKMF